MIHSSLIKKLNEWVFIQYIFSALPTLFIIIYIFAYMTNLMSIVRVVTYNDSITQQAYDNGILKEVDHFKENSDGTYSATISGDASYEIEAKLNEELFSIYFLGQDWYSIITNNNGVLYTTTTDLVDELKVSDGNYSIIKGSQEMPIKPDGLVCTVSLDSLGSYKITYAEDDIDSFTIDELAMVQLKLVNDDSYRFDISASYSKDVGVISPNFCTNLPTNNLYYDEVDMTFVQNISEDFAKNFILGSNIGIVFFSMTLFCILLNLIRKRHELTVLEHKEVMLVNILAVLLLPLCILFTIAFI